MRVVRLALLTLALAGLVAVATPAAQADACISPTNPTLCPPGSIPWRTSSSHGCHGAGFTCAALW